MTTERVCPVGVAADPRQSAEAIQTLVACGAKVIEGRCRWTHPTGYGCGDRLADHGSGLPVSQVKPWDHPYDGWECVQGHEVAASEEVLG